MSAAASHAITRCGHGCWFCGRRRARCSRSSLLGHLWYVRRLVRWRNLTRQPDGPDGPSQPMDTQISETPLSLPRPASTLAHTSLSPPGVPRVDLAKLLSPRGGGKTSARVDYVTSGPKRRRRESSPTGVATPDANGGETRPKRRRVSSAKIRDGGGWTKPGAGNK